MLQLKHGVTLEGVQPQVAILLSVAESVFREAGYICFVTSIADSKHAVADSLHYHGLAVDLRVPSWYGAPQTEDELVANRLRECLGGAEGDFDVILERGPDHIHVEWQPVSKGGSPTI